MGSEDSVARRVVGVSLGARSAGCALWCIATVAHGQSIVGSGEFSPQRALERSSAVVGVDNFGLRCCVVRGDGRVVVFGPSEMASSASFPWNAWIDLAASVPTLRDVSCAAIGGAHVVAITGSGAVRCVGFNADGQCTVPAELGAAIDVAAGLRTSLAIDAVGGLHVWGRIPESLPHGPDDLGAARAVDCHDAFVVVAQSDGSVRAWGRQVLPAGNGTLIPSIPATWPHDVVEVAAGDVYLLALRENGELLSLNWGPSTRTTFLLTPTEVRQIDADGAFAVVELGSGWAIPNVEASWLLPPPPQGTPGLEQLHVSPGFLVGIDDGGGLASPNTPSAVQPDIGSGALPHGIRTPVDGYATGRGVLVLNEDGAIASFSRCFAPECQLPPDIGPAAAISGAESHDMVLLHDGTVECYGTNQYGCCDVPGDLPEAVSVVAADGLSCARLADGSLRLWGRNEDGQLSPPPLPGGVAHVTLLSSSVWATLTDGTVRCWGASDQHGWCTAMSLESEVDSTFIGQGGLFVLHKDGTVALYGYSGAPPVTLPATGVVELGRFHALGSATVGRLVDGSLVKLEANEEVAIPWRVTRLCKGGELAIIADDTCADLDADGIVGGAELAAVLGAWGTDGTGTGGGSSGQGADFDGSGLVDGADLLIVLSQYGECGP